MTALYLEKIALRQFRSFASLDVELAPEPGVLIVHGSNGLGKSSLFDALEWTFADRIDHFRDAVGVNKPGTYLCRWRDNALGPTSATATFSDGNRIERSLLNATASSSTLSGTVTDITEFLRTSAWRQSISGLDRYLLLTHFLGQSTLSRLTNRSATERFDILKEAAQSTSIQAVANALHGQGNTTVVRAYARRCESLESSIKSLADLLDQEGSFWIEAQAAGALDEKVALQEARRLAAQLMLAWVGAAPGAPAPSSDSEPTVEQLQALADAIDADGLVIEGRIDTARQLFAARQRYGTELGEIAASRAAAETRLASLSEELEQARSQVQAQRLTLSGAHNALAAAVKALGQLQALREVRDRATRNAAEVESAASALVLAAAATAAAGRRVTAESRRRSLVQRLSAEVDRLGQDQDGARQALALIDETRALDVLLVQQSEELAALDAADPGIDGAVQAAEQRWSAAVESVSVQTGVVDGLRETVDVLSSAIASIAANLPADACNCPVCASQFDNPPKLQARIASAGGRLAPALLLQEERLRDLMDARDAANLELQRLRRAHTAIQGVKTTLAAAREQRARLATRLDAATSASPEALATARIKVLADIEALRTRRARRERWIARLTLEGADSNGYSRAVRERDAAQQAEDEAQRAVDIAVARLESSRSEAVSTQAVISPNQNLASDQLAERVAAAEAHLEHTQAQLRIATETLTSAEGRAAALDAEEAALRARQTDLSDRKASLEVGTEKLLRDWRELERFGTQPALDVIAQIEARLSASRLTVKASLGQLARLREGRLAWSRQLSHRAVFEQLRALVDAPPSAERDAVRAAAEVSRAGLADELNDVRQVKETARAASADITAELESFNVEYIKPLSFLMAQINQAILCDPRVGIDLHVKRKKIEQIARKGSEVPKALGDIDPVLVHSEGQMAALAVSMLTAASLTFPWSRWKALVLDDPLQHNDSIHAAAFADLMGNLITAEGYQILLSTHDVAQAEFLQRKFRSRRIPCTTLSLLGIGKEGVEWSVQNSTVSQPQAVSA
ncbi:AAA family ATPase [Brevundimonas sp. SL161]|uniref:AAA family ATPase n=1 Tax=Brevundimonas sp. SL161 TaxID=2804613 RepID=UPI003CF301DA